MFQLSWLRRQESIHEVFPGRIQAVEPRRKEEGELAKQEGVDAEDQRSVATQTRARPE